MAKRTLDRKAAIKSVGRSLTISALLPFLVYRLLAPHFPAASVTPLLVATLFPISRLIVRLIHARSVDAIALMAMVGIGIHVAVILVTRNIGIALVARALDGAIIGLVLVISAMIGRPLLFLIVRRVAAAHNAPLEVIEHDGRRTFLMLTIVWGVSLIASSGVHVVLALRLAPATFLLVSPILGVATAIALVAWSVRYVRSRVRSSSEPS